MTIEECIVWGCNYLLWEAAFRRMFDLDKERKHGAFKTMAEYEYREVSALYDDLLRFLEDSYAQEK